MSEERIRREIAWRVVALAAGCVPGCAHLRESYSRRPTMHRNQNHMIVTTSFFSARSKFRVDLPQARRAGRSSDLSPSDCASRLPGNDVVVCGGLQPVASCEAAQYGGLTAAGTVRDSHPIPF